MDRTFLLLSALCLAFSAVGAVRADEHLGARASVLRPLAARNEEDATAAATTVELKGRPMALETLRDVMPEVPSALPIANGGYGAFSSISLRGTDLGQTVWLLGDVPLNSPDTGAFDLSLMPVSQLERVEVYRGGAPIWLGQGSIGGVIRLMPREEHGQGGGLRLSAGSYGLYQLNGSGHVTRSGARSVSLYSGIQATSSDGNFRYLDDVGTRFDASDDVERRMKNAQVADGAGLFHLRVGLGRGYLDTVFYGIERQGGIPGAGGQNNAQNTRRALRRGLLTTAYTLERVQRRTRLWRLQLLVSGQGEDRKIDDPLSELGGRGPSAVTQTWLRGYGRLAASYLVLPFLETTATLSAATDHFDDVDRVAFDPIGPSARTTQAAAFELRGFGRVFGFRSELRGSVRGEWTQTDIERLKVAREVHDHQTLFAGIYRVSAAVEPTTGLTLRASGGTGQRVPSILELFGDGATLLENPKLEPEKGVYVDAGAVLSGALRDVCATLDLNAFLQHVDDKITYRLTNQFESVAENVAKSEVRGLELGLDTAYHRALRLVASATLMDTRTHLDLALPRQPSFRTYSRVESSLFPKGKIDRVTFFATVDHVSSAYFDSANLAQRAPLTHVGFGGALALWRERLELGARVADVFDVRGQDYQRFPLPGRFFALSISLREESL